MSSSSAPAADEGGAPGPGFSGLLVDVQRVDPLGVRRQMIGLANISGHRVPLDLSLRIFSRRSREDHAASSAGHHHVRVTLSDGATRVVCQPDSVKRAQRSIQTAESTGYVIRPTVGPQTISADQGRALMDLNRKLSKRCSFNSIQDAVNQSGNNGRVVIMPGLYTEPASRSAPTHDPACAQYEITNDRGEAGAVSCEGATVLAHTNRMVSTLSVSSVSNSSAKLVPLALRLLQDARRMDR